MVRTGSPPSIAKRSLSTADLRTSTAKLTQYLSSGQARLWRGPLVSSYININLHASRERARPLTSRQLHIRDWFVSRLFNMTAEQLCRVAFVPAARNVPFGEFGGKSANFPAGQTGGSEERRQERRPFPPDELLPINAFVDDISDESRVGLGSCTAQKKLKFALFTNRLCSQLAVRFSPSHIKFGAPSPYSMAG